MTAPFSPASSGIDEGERNWHSSTTSPCKGEVGAAAPGGGRALFRAPAIDSQITTRTIVMPGLVVQPGNDGWWRKYPPDSAASGIDAPAQIP